MDSSAASLSLTKCFHCQQLLDEPYTFSECLHSLCASCLKEVKEGGENTSAGLVCPICQTTSKEVTHNMFLSHLALQDSPEADSLTCKQCGHIKPLTSFWHCDCGCSFCVTCKDGHLRHEINKDHKATSHGESADALVNYTIKCSVHKSKTVEYYCKECHMCICITCCQVMPHKRHDILTMTDALEELQSELKSQVEDLKTQVTSNDCTIEQIDQTVTNFENRRDCVLHEIDQAAQRKIVEIERQKELQKERLRNETDNQVQSLKTAKAKFMRKQDTSQHLQNVIATTLERAEDGVLLNEIVQRGLLQKSKRMRVNKVMEMVDLRMPKWDEDGDLTKTLLGKLYDEHNRLHFGYKHRDKKYFDGSITKLFERDLSQTLEIKLDEPCKKVTIARQYVLVPLMKAELVKVYTLDGKPDKDKDMKIDGEPTSIAETHTGDLIITSSNGLFVKDIENGGNPTKVAEGCFADMCLFERRLFCLDWRQGQIVEFVKTGVGEWKKEEPVVSMNISSDSRDPEDTFLVRKCQEQLQYIICLHKEGKILFLNADGTLQEFPEKLVTGVHDHYMCCISDAGELLVADRASYRYKVFNISTQEWRCVYTGDDWVYDAHIQNDQSVWFCRHKQNEPVITKHEEMNL